MNLKEDNQINIPYGKQHIDASDRKAVLEVLRSDFLTTGPKVPQFEQCLSRLIDIEYVTAVNSATSGLHLACLALGLGKGDLLWTSAISFVASANCGVYCGAKVDFVDICKETFNISAKTLLNKIKSSEKLPNVLVLVHLCGLPSDLEEIHKICKKYNIKIIEDASHSLGAKYKNSYVGNCKYSDISVFSFHPVKMITTGEGGAITTRSKALDKKLKLLRSHGIFRKPIEDHKRPWFYDQIDLGFNYRMNDIEAALGINQLKRLKLFLKERNKIATRYYQKLNNLPISFQTIPSDSLSSYHLFVIQIRSDYETPNFKDTRLRLFQHLLDNGIQVNLHYMPIYQHSFYKKFGNYESCTNAEDYCSRSISLPIYYGLSKKQQNHVIESIKEFFHIKGL